MTVLYEIIKTTVFETISQLISVLGIFFIFGLTLHFISRLTRIIFVKSAGVKFYTYWTGWLGVPIHEMGHIIFCIIFRHKITEIQLFKPDPASGVLGYVNHKYNKKSIYQKIGNFFIGAGPIIFGAVVLYITMKYLVPNNEKILGMIAVKTSQFAGTINFGLYINVIIQTGEETFKLLFIKSNMNSVVFWIFMYISLSVASQMELSYSDLKGLRYGLLTMSGLLFIVNAVALTLGVNISNYTILINRYTGFFTGLFASAVVISVLNFAAWFLLLSILYFLKRKKVLNPFF